MKRLFLLFFILLIFSFPASATEKQIGQSCSGDSSATDWDTIAQCANGTMVKAPLILGSPSTSTYATTTCDSSKAGMIQWNGSNFQGCDGSSWVAFGSSGSGSSGGTPAAFSFTDQTGVAVATTITSNTVTLSGFTGVVSGACSAGCTGIVKNGTNIGTSGNFVAGDTVALTQTSSPSASTATTASVIIGSTTSSAWSVTTKATGGTLYVANTGAGNIAVVDTGTNSIVSTITVGSSPQQMALNASLGRVYVANPGSSTMSVIDTTTNAVVATISSLTKIYGAIVDTYTNYVYGGGSLATSAVYVIDGNTNTLKTTISPESGNYYFWGDFSPSFNRIIIPSLYSTNPGTVYSIDASSNSLVATVTVGKYPYQVLMDNGNNRFFVSNNADGTVSVVNIYSNAVVKTITVGSSPVGLALNPNTNRLYVANYAGNSVSVIDTTSLNVVSTISVCANPYGITARPATNKIYVGCIGASANAVGVIDGATNTMTTTISGFNSPQYLLMTSN